MSIPPVLWWILGILAGLFILGSAHSDAPVGKGALGCILGTWLWGLVSVVLLAVVFAPVVILFYGLKWSYGISALVGLPLGLILVAVLATRICSVLPESHTTDDSTDEPAG